VRPEAVVIESARAGQITQVVQEFLRSLQIGQADRHGNQKKAESRAPAAQSQQTDNQDAGVNLDPGRQRENAAGEAFAHQGFVLQSPRPKNNQHEHQKITIPVTLGKLANMTSGPPQTDNYQSLTKTK